MVERAIRRLWADDAGMSTVESAYAIAGIVATVLFGLAGASAVSTQVRCIDAAREVARLTAAGDPSARTVGTRVAPTGAAIEIELGEELVEVSVTDRVSLLGIDIRGRAVAAREHDSVTEVETDAPVDH